MLSDDDNAARSMMDEYQPDADIQKVIMTIMTVYCGYVNSSDDSLLNQTSIISFFKDVLKNSNADFQSGNWATMYSFADSFLQSIEQNQMFMTILITILPLLLL